MPAKGKWGQLHQDQQSGAVESWAPVELQKVKQATVSWQLKQNCCSLDPKMQLQVPYHGLLVNPSGYSLSLPGTSSQKHFFPPAVLPDGKAFILLITSTLHVLTNHFCP